MTDKPMEKDNRICYAMEEHDSYDHRGTYVALHNNTKAVVCIVYQQKKLELIT